MYQLLLFFIEIALWFKDEELVKWDPNGMTWVYEDFEPTVV